MRVLTLDSLDGLGSLDDRKRELRATQDELLKVYELYDQLVVATEQGEILQARFENLQARYDMLVDETTRLENRFDTAAFSTDISERQWMNDAAALRRLMKAWNREVEVELGIVMRRFLTVGAVSVVVLGGLTFWWLNR